MSRPPMRTPTAPMWTPTAQCFAQHHLSHALNFWRLGHPAVYHLESLSDGRAKLNLSFCLPPPSEIIPPPPSFSHPIPPHYSRRPGAPTPPPKRPIVPLFPPGEAPLQTLRPSPGPRQAPALSSKQRKSHRRAVLHRASQATPSLPPALPGTLRWQCAGLLQRAFAAATCPQPAAPHLQQHSPEAPNSTPLQAPQSSGKRLHSPSPETLSHRLRLESLRETPLPSSPGSPTLNLTPVPFTQPPAPSPAQGPYPGPHHPLPTPRGSRLQR